MSSNIEKLTVDSEGNILSDKGKIVDVVPMGKIEIVPDIMIKGTLEEISREKAPPGAYGYTFGKIKVIYNANCSHPQEQEIFAYQFYRLR